MPRKDSDLFTPIATERLHIAFRLLLESPFHWAARNLMSDLFGRMGDPDGNFVKDFQTDGFHSRMFEIACYAYLEAQGLEIERSDRPDFMVARDGQRAALEATTTNPRSGRGTDISIRKVEPLSEAEIFDKCSNEFPIRMGSALRGKLEKKYWELPHCTNIPFALIVGPFHEPGSTTYIDDSLARYLYGTETFDDWTERNGVLVRGEVPVRTHEFGEKSIPSNFFAEQEAENISAVVYCNQFTVPRFYRMAAQMGSAPANVTDVRTGSCLLPGEGFLEYRYVVGRNGTPVETWWQGVTILHNPRARHPLPDGFLACTSEYRHAEGRLERVVHDLHPLTSFMHGSVHPVNPTPNAPSQSDFEEARTRARTTIQTGWRKIARRHTLGWVQPIEELERIAPFTSRSLAEIRRRLTPWLPALVYQSREPSPREMIAAVPCLDKRGRPLGCRLIASTTLSRDDGKTYGDFSEAFWFALAQRMLPPVQNRKALEAALARWTDRRLLEI